MSKVIGNLWRKKSGNLVASGVIEVIAGNPIRVALFINERKKPESKEPDFNLVVSKPLEKKNPEIKEIENKGL